MCEVKINKPLFSPFVSRLGADGSVEVSRKRNGTEGVYQCLVRHQVGQVLGYPVHWKFACEYDQILNILY
jgi:hypothetical protein